MKGFSKKSPYVMHMVIFGLEEGMHMALIETTVFYYAAIIYKFSSCRLPFLDDLQAGEFLTFLFFERILDRGGQLGVERDCDVF